MKISGYIMSKAIAIVVFLATVVAVALLLWVVGVGVVAVAACCIMLLVAFVFALAWDYAMRRRFYHELSLAIKAGQDANYMTEHLRRPNFLEGQLAYDAMVQATKSMNDHIADYRIAGDEYRDYVETWIHEVKTPIAAARLILDNNSGGPLHQLEHEMDRIEAHVEQALYYARSTAVEKDYAIKQINLGDAVRSCIKKHSRLLIDSEITPTFEGLDVCVYADPKWLDFVFGQIITNSVKYRRPRVEGFTAQIDFIAERIDDAFETSRLRLHIRDNGIGIPATDVGRVFEKGFTGKNGRAFAKSTGIGLYLCKQLCLKMRLGLTIKSVVAADGGEDGAEPSAEAVAGAGMSAGVRPSKQPAASGSGTTVTIEFPLNKMYFLA